MENCLLQHPPKVHIFDPVRGTIRRTFVFVGDVPKAVLYAAKQYETHSSERILKEYYGSDWKKKLAIGKFGGAIDDWFAAITENDPFAGEPITTSMVNISKIGGEDDEDDEESMLDVEILADSKQPNIPAVKNSRFDDIDIDDAELALDAEILADEKPVPGKQVKQREHAVSVFEDNVDLSVSFSPGVEIVAGSSVSIYPEDKMSELKEKIYLATGIPAYRQHIFYIDRGRITTTYRIYAEGARSTDIRELAQSRDAILGIPIDRLLYEYRDEIRVESLDEFRLVHQIPLGTAIYVVDLSQFIDHVRSQFVEMLRDTYQFDLFYYGFVIKYWPQLTQECFYLYIANEIDLMHKFPDLAKQKSILARKYAAEREVINSVYHSSGKIMAWSNRAKSPVTISITQMIATINAPRYIVNVRNLFDGLTVSKCIPEIHAYIEHDNKKFLLRKSFIRNEADISFPANLKTGLVIAISLKRTDQESYHKKRALSTVENEQSRYLFLNILPSGKYFVKTMWNEEDEYGFEEVIDIMKKFTDKIISEINAMGKYVFTNGGQLTPISRGNIVYNSLNIAIFWKKILTESSFRLVKSLWDQYIKAGVVTSRGIQTNDKFEFIFHKGITDFENVNIEKIMTASNNIILQNFYSHLSNPSIKQKWDAVYNHHGRTVVMQHRTTDLKFEVKNIRELEFKLFHRYILEFILSASCNERVKHIIPPTREYDVGTVKKLKKAKEIDPNLFNLKKYGSKKVYSILCQNPRQPMIYTAEEMAAMSQREHDRLVKYWNFTLNKPAYYGCPNRKYPHLSFLVGIHPRHYCLPCCGKKAMTEASKKSKITRICLTKHAFVSCDERDEEADTADKQMSQRHIMGYGKDIEAGRLSKLPNGSLRDLLATTLTEVQAEPQDMDEAAIKSRNEENATGYYIFGVPQHTPAVKNVGYIYAVAEVTGLTVPELVKQMIIGMKKNPNMFNILLNGSLLETFSSIDDLINVMNEIFIDTKQFTYDKFRFTSWNNLFIELAVYLLGIYTFVFADDGGHGEHVNLYVSSIVQTDLIFSAKLGSQTPIENRKFMIVVRKDTAYYPIFLMNPATYFKTYHISRKIFVDRDTAVQLLVDAVVTASRKSLTEINKPADLNLIKEFVIDKKYTIATKFINRQNLCYALLLSAGDTGHVYVPVINSSYANDGVKTQFTAFRRSEHDLNGPALQKFISDFNSFIEQKYKIADGSQNDLFLYSKVLPAKYLKYKGKIIGFASSTRLLYYVTSQDMDLTQFRAPTVDMMYDYDDVNAAIVSRKPNVEDNRSSRLGSSLYHNFMYQLFVVEFVNFLESERNDKLRAELMALIQNLNIKGESDISEFQTALKNLIAGFPADMASLQSQLSDYFYNHRNKQTFITTVKSGVYDFDRTTMTRLKSLGHDEMIRELEKIADKFSIEQALESSSFKFPNVYMPCEYDNSAGYCAGTKLIVENRKSLIDLLAADIMNPIKERYILSGLFADNTVDFFRFAQRPNETILITRISQQKLKGQLS